MPSPLLDDSLLVRLALTLAATWAAVRLLGRFFWRGEDPPPGPGKEPP